MKVIVDMGKEGQVFWLMGQKLWNESGFTYDLDTNLNITHRWKLDEM